MAAKRPRPGKSKVNPGKPARLPPDKPAGGIRAFLMKPAVWLTGIVLAAAGTALTSWLVPQFGQVIGRLTETGDPVTVKVVQEEINQSLALPPGTRLTGRDLAELGSLTPEEQLESLTGRGAERDAPEILSLVVTGNRIEPVRIVNVKPVADCSSPASRTRVNLTGNFGAVDLSTAMVFDLDRDPATAMFGDGEASSPYFPARTISLKKGEQVVVTVAAATAKRHCRFEFDVVVLSGSEEHTQRISNGGRPFVRLASDPGAYEHVYWGGQACRAYTEHKGSWSDEICPGG
jgi:hypothetical protein